MEKLDAGTPTDYICAMTRLKKIESEISALNAEDFNTLADWIAERREALWDAQIASDAKAGRLDGLLAEARADIAAGDSKRL